MKNKKSKIYIAEDGYWSSDREECLRYERYLKEIRAIEEKYICPIPDRLVEADHFKMGLGYLQHDPENFEQMKREALDLFCEEFRETAIPFIRDYDRKEDSIIDFLGDVNVTELDEREAALDYLAFCFDAKHQLPYVKFWQRVMRTDENYKEWGYDFFNEVEAKRRDSDINPIQINR